MDIFKKAEELYEDYRQTDGDGDNAWDKAKDEAKRIIDRQRKEEDRRSGK